MFIRCFWNCEFKIEIVNSWIWWIFAFQIYSTYRVRIVWSSFLYTRNAGYCWLLQGSTMSSPPVPSWKKSEWGLSGYNTEVWSWENKITKFKNVRNNTIFLFRLPWKTEKENVTSMHKYMDDRLLLRFKENLHHKYPKWTWN
jgi:hypothetical protein